MQQPGRKFQGSSISKYRYSINGQEKESEINEDITTALFWQYDSRIGRRWNIDPVNNIYESPYLCFSGNPIMLVDYNGDEAFDNSKPKKKKASNGVTATKRKIIPPRNLSESTNPCPGCPRPTAVSVAPTPDEPLAYTTVGKAAVEPYLTASLEIPANTALSA